MLHPAKRILGKYLFHLPRKKFGSFQFNGRTFPYFCNLYNQTWMNERCIEVPLAMQYVKPGLRILEVGRVLDHYFSFPHTCVDKFEKGAVNIDIVDFKPSEKFDLILSVSTLEHVGWDEDRNPEKFFTALEVLKSNLAPGGRLVVTLPVGYNENLQPHMISGERLFDEQYYFARNRKGDWRQTESPVVTDFNFRDGWATSFMLGMTTGR